MAKALLAQMVTNACQNVTYTNDIHIEAWEDPPIFREIWELTKYTFFYKQQVYKLRPLKNAATFEAQKSPVA